MMMKVQVLDPNGNLSPTERSVVEKVHRLSRAAGLTHMPEVGIYQSSVAKLVSSVPPHRTNADVFKLFNDIQ